MSKRILLVDDEPDILEILSYNLARRDFVIGRASSGVECLRVAKQFKPDLIVMDIRMPEMNGIEACRIIKHDDELKSIHIIFLTADTDTLTALSAIRAGGGHYVNKPIRISLLTELIEEILAAHDTRRTGTGD